MIARGYEFYWTIPEDFRTFSENFDVFRNNSEWTVRSSYRHFRSFSENFRRLPKVASISEQSSKMFQSCRNKSRFVTIKLGKLDSTFDFIDIFECEDIKFIDTSEDITTISDVFPQNFGHNTHDDITCK